jgi:uncharacterized protein YhhL (DUF1145 family)
VAVYIRDNHSFIFILIRFSSERLLISDWLLVWQVINTNLLFENPFPADRTVAIVKQSAQLVHAADMKPVPADEVNPVPFHT